MLGDLKAYISECWKQAPLSWRKGAVIMTALISVALFVALLLGWQLEAYPVSIFLVGTGIIATFDVLAIFPYQLWKANIAEIKSLKEQIADLRAAQLPKAPIALGWRFSRPYCELVLRSAGPKSTDVDVKVRNLKRPDDTETIDILQSLPSNDGKQTPVTLYQGEPVYFRFAELKNTGIVVPTVGQTERHVGQETVVKLSISGPDVPFAAIHLHLTVAGNIIDIKKWERPRAA